MRAPLLPAVFAVVVEAAVPAIGFPVCAPSVRATTRFLRGNLLMRSDAQADTELIRHISSDTELADAKATSYFFQRVRRIELIGMLNGTTGGRRSYLLCSRQARSRDAPGR